MAMQNSPVGYMIYQCIMHFGDSPWRGFKVTMTEQQRKDQLEKLVREITSLQNAMKAKDPSLARGGTQFVLSGRTKEHMIAYDKELRPYNDIRRGSNPLGRGYEDPSPHGCI